MNPTPLIPLALVLACPLAALWAFWSSTTARHAALIGVVVTPLVAFAIPPIGLACIMVARDNGWAWTVETVANLGLILGLISAALAIPCGLAAALIGRGFSVWLFPPGNVRQQGESLASTSRRAGVAMTLGRALFTIVTCILVFAVLGGAIGLGLGTFVPDYYRSSYRQGFTPEFDPVSVGLGQGVSQGVAGGAVVGVVLLIFRAWYDLRRGSGSRDPNTLS